MKRLQETIKLARRRQTINRMIHAGGYGAAVMLGASLLILLIERLLLGGARGLEGLGGVTWQLYAIFISIGALCGAVWPLLRLSDPSVIALQLDRALHLKDQVATAHAMSGRGAALAIRTGPRYDDEFAQLVQRDADRVAAIIDVRNVMPIRVTGIWAFFTIGLIVFATCFLFVPNVAWGEEDAAFSHEREQIEQQLQEQREQEREELLAAIDEVVEEARAESAVDARTREQLQALERLSEQLRANEGDVEDIEHLRDETAAVLNELSSRLAEQAQREQIASETVAERFNSLQTPDTPMSAEQFTEALKRGDFGRAADSLEELLERRNELSELQRRELAEHLQDLSQQLDQVSDQRNQELAERAAQLEQALREQGVDEETIQQLLDQLPRSEEQINRELLNEQLDEDVARRLARELKRLQDEREIEQQVQDDARTVNETLQDAARQLDESMPEDHSEPEQHGDDVADPGDPQATPGTEADDRSDPTGDPSDDRSETGEPGEQTEQAQEQREAAEQQRGVTEDETREQAGEAGEQASQQSDPDEAGEQEAAGEPSQQEGESPESGPSGEGETDDAAQDVGGSGGEGEQGRSPGDALREMQQRRDAANQMRQSSERMRQRSREMAEGQRSQATASEAETPGGDGAGRSSSIQRSDDQTAHEPLQHEIEDLDLRDENIEGGELIAEWMDPSSPRQGDPQTRRVEAEQRVRQAQEIAERAVNESAVPSRYHERIRRYFGRLNETVERASDGANQDTP